MNDMLMESPALEQAETPTQNLALGHRHRVRARDLLVTAKPVTPLINNLQVAELFHGHADVTCVAVVEDDIPIGIINRNLFMEGFARPFGRDIFGRKSCIAYPVFNNTHKNPLIIIRLARTRISDS